jgi:DNA-binding protein H-NS
MPTVRELKDQIATLQAELNARIVLERKEVIAEIKEQISIYQIPVEALWGQDPKKKMPIGTIFKDPVSGKTWSGKGPAPQWIAGKDRESFRIAVA